MFRYFLKYSNVEFGERWWFLNEVLDSQHFKQCTSVVLLKHLKDIKLAKFVKRYSSEEVLDIDVDLSYGKCKVKSIK